MKILLTYTSMTGRNKKIAEYLANYLESKKAEVTLQEMVDADAFEILNYDALIVDTYTYHDGEVPDEAQDFYDDLKDIDLEKTKFAVLGSSSNENIRIQDYLDFIDFFDQFLSKLRE